MTLFMGMIGHFHMTRPHLIELYTVAFLLTALCWERHKANIGRLIAGTESKTHLFGHRD